jgi:hypothetical protein
MMYNSLDRLLDGMAATLRDDIAPQVDDPYVRAQAQTAAELLAHLAEHVEWRCDHLRAEIDAARAALPHDTTPPAATIIQNHALIETHERLLHEIATQSGAALDAFARRYHALDYERFVSARDRIRTAR